MSLKTRLNGADTKRMEKSTDSVTEKIFSGGEANKKSVRGKINSKLLNV